MLRLAGAWGTCLVMACAADHVAAPADASSLNAVETYLKASNADPGDLFGATIALAADGDTLVVGAPSEASAAAGIDAIQRDNRAPYSGAVYVFTRRGDTWAQSAFIKASNPDELDSFGDAVALSRDGNTLAIGAPGESSSATGIDGAQSDNTATMSGAVYVFTRTVTTWRQEAYVKASNTERFDAFGRSISLSADGNTLAVGAAGKAISSSGTPPDYSSLAAGAAYVFERQNGVWDQQAYVRATDAAAGAYFGIAVSISGDGSTLAVGANGGGNGLPITQSNPGKAYVFSRSGSMWLQQPILSSPAIDDSFGTTVALSEDATALAVGAWRDDSGAVGVNGDVSNRNRQNSGAVYMFGRGEVDWTQQAFIKASNTRANGFFGYSLSLSPDGSRLAVGASGDSSAATGIDGDQLDDSAKLAGAAYLFTNTGSSWVQHAYVKASNTAPQACFSIVALSNDSSQLIVGAPDESSSARGVGGNQLDNSASESGAVYAIAITKPE